MTDGERAPAQERRAAEAGDPTRGRWGIVLAAVLVQLALGAVYAWSVFNKPLQGQFGWSKSQAVLPFEAAIGTIF
ncbi:MAG TPA: MFS transporter, partial [Mycobacteriales bacterium]|nr:MFS transporter [Mycobacteriales bacterium]